MKAQRLVLFSLASLVAYTPAYYFDWALFRLYPQTGRLEWLSPPRIDSLSVAWYGWLAVSVVAGAFIAVLTPLRFARRVPADSIWFVLFIAVAATLLYEKRWFF